eukprot:1738596-Prymnesium_polylepis.1
MYYSTVQRGIVNQSVATLCRPCPEGTSCSWDTDISTIKMLPGWWRLSDSTLDVRRCGSNDTLGGCIGGNVTGICEDGQTGAMCKSCARD